MMDCFFVKPGSNKRVRENKTDQSRPSFARNDSKRSRGTRGARRGTSLRGRGGSGRADLSVTHENGAVPRQNGTGTKSRSMNALEEEISSGESDNDQVDDDIVLRRDLSEAEDETEQEKRLRLTKDYLRQLEEHTE